MVYDAGHWNSIRKAVLIRWGHKCISCGSEATEVHHIRPRRYGGHDHPRNLMPLCTSCHADMHRLLEEEIEEAITRATAQIDGSGEMYD